MKTIISLLKTSFILLIKLDKTIYLLWFIAFISLCFSYPNTFLLKLLLISGLLSIGFVLFVVIIAVICYSVENKNKDGK